MIVHKELKKSPAFKMCLKNYRASTIKNLPKKLWKIAIGLILMFVLGYFQTGFNRSLNLSKTTTELLEIETEFVPASFAMSFLFWVILIFAFWDLIKLCFPYRILEIGVYSKEEATQTEGISNLVVEKKGNKYRNYIVESQAWNDISSDNKYLFLCRGRTICEVFEWLGPYDFRRDI